MSLPAIDLDSARGLVLIAVLAGFLGIWAWAWSSKRKPVFRNASRLPLEDDLAAVPPGGETKDGTKE
ncbi:MAG TPA: cbb3-type cytochrome c oxidase subunit 3 [Xanthomonadales bacterium]|nr:cbb3-type cytochrome c oxidase subunit 3 [Xanthomonadales bacterium]